jgi:RimJ/RimL family protein N-acetyltransferase
MMSEINPTGSPGDELWLRAVTDSDLPIFFEQQRDPEANYMAAFTAANPSDRAAFDAHWARIRANEANIVQTIVWNGQVAGNLMHFEMFGRPQVAYWLGREFWGRGLATRALAAFLEELPVRPLYAQAAADNAASIRVLQKCGFEITGRERDFANARGQEIEEVILILDRQEA